MPSYRGGMARSYPPFPPGSKTACVDLDGHLPADAPDIEYPADDDTVLEEWLRSNASTTWHTLGTGKMLSRNYNSVADVNRSVYGVKGLKITNFSIVPGNVAANTNHTALVVGDKAAGIFIKAIGS